MTLADKVLIVTGFPRGGTTLYSSFLCHHPSVVGGFECGFLLGDHPIHAFDHPDWKRSLVDSWQLPESFPEILASVDSPAEAYDALMEMSGLMEGRAPGEVILMDKHPAYMPILGDVLRKHGGSAQVVLRHPVVSVARWRHHQPQLPEEAILAQVSAYAKGFVKAVSRHPSRVNATLMRDLLAQPEAVIRNLFNQVGLDFRPEYACVNPRFPNVKPVLDPALDSKLASNIGPDLQLAVEQAAGRAFWRAYHDAALEPDWSAEEMPPV